MTPLDSLVAQAREALREKRYHDVETLCDRVLARDPQYSVALVLAGEVAMKQGQLELAVEYYDRVPDSDREQAAIARLAAGDILLHANRAAAAERELRASLSLDVGLTAAHERLAWLLGVEGRRYESLPHLYALLRLKHFQIESLMAAGDHDAALEDPQRVDAFREAEPDDVLPLVGTARIELHHDRAQARRLLEEVLTKLPELAEAQALLGRVLWELGDEQGLAAWEARLPSSADGHPDVWSVRGEIARKAGQPQVAARCFWEALRRDASHQTATYQLSRLLPTLRQGAEPFSAEDIRFLVDRASRLERLAEVLDGLHTRADDGDLVRQAASLTESLGRLWESWAWHQAARARSSDTAWIAEGLARIEPQLSPTLGDTLASCDPGHRLDLSDFPLPTHTLGPRPDLPEPSPSVATTRPGKPTPDPTFRDVAAEFGLDFTYYRGCEPAAGDGRMFEFTGGGVAVLDFDLDGWPDLYFPQGCRWPPAADQTEFLDQIFRNHDGQHFRPVTDRARLVEDRFSQGAAVGDFNADGFPDLYVANIGVNRLFMNCGDGTFVDVTDTAGLTDASWTTSVLLADLDGDGLPDLYDVNYVKGQDVFERVCEREGKPRNCPPGAFTPAPDRVLLNLGDGRFADKTEESGVAQAIGGNGLGIVAADFENTGRLGLFVANDQDANFYFVNRGTGRDGTPRFVEMGLVSGLAYDGRGTAQACMGVAAGDANGDGRLDLFVTNFYHESNTLYLHEQADLFSDGTVAAGLSEPSHEMLGFGTQFIDGELDGLPDLVIANGHVDDFRYVGIPYAMRPQYFRNLGAGHFSELEPQRLGEFFTRSYLGRGLARLDFDRDGREDFAVSHLDAPVALVANETGTVGHFFALKLHGTKSARDAIGTRVTVAANGNRRTRQLTAGDGYMASNQRQLVFGLGPAQVVDEVVIEWPSGARQSWQDLPIDREWIAIEGTANLAVQPK